MGRAKSKAAQTIERTAFEKAQDIIRAALPDAELFEIRQDEGRFPVCLALVPRDGGGSEAITVFFATHLNVDSPAFHVASGWIHEYSED